MNELQQRFIRARRQAIALNYQHLNDKQAALPRHWHPTAAA